MKKGFKQKLSLLMIACLLFTGYQGLTISGRADSSHPEQNNEIEVSGSQVKVQLLGADLRRAATEAILKGEKVGKGNLASYSKDQELATEFEEYFDGEKEIYNIPLNSIAENLEESLNAEEAGLQIYVERDAKNLEKLVRKESKESLLLYSKESAVAGLLPKKEEATTVSLTGEEKASDSNLERNTELTGSELITFVYENKSTERMTFQLSVDGNKYPKVTVSSKTSLFKQFLSDAKKAQAEAKNAKATEAKVETTVTQTSEENKAEVESTEAKQESTEAQTTEESKASEEAQKDSDVALVSTAAEATEESLEATEAKVEEEVEASEEVKEEKTEAPAEEAKKVATEAETTKVEKATEAVKASAEDTGLLKEITEHSEEFLPELHTVRFTQYSLNELGRKSQNVEVEGFGNIQVFYEEAAFDSDVVLEAKRLFKPEEEVEGEKLTEDQVKVLKEHSIYDDAASLDIRFVDKKDSTTEVEPKSPVSVRISIDKKALPENVSSDSVSIHHLIENDETKEIEKVDTVVQPNNSKNLILADDSTNNDEVEKRLEKLTSTLKKEDYTKDETITKEFTVNAFSLYQITWRADAPCGLCDAATYIRFHYVDKNFNEIGPTTRIDISAKGANWHRDEEHTFTDFQDGNKVKYYVNFADAEKRRLYIDHNELGSDVYYDRSTKTGKAKKDFYGYDFLEVYPYNPKRDNMDIWKHGEQEDYFTINWSYGPDDGDFRKGLERIDNTGYTLSTILPDVSTPRFTWFTKDKGEPAIRLCETNDFYFVYDTKRKKADQREEEPRNEKYIKDNLNGTYDLTLTGQVRKKKEKLDIIFLLDSTKSMNSSFGAEGSKKEVTKKNLESLVDKLSKNPSYDLQYALVGFGGERTEKDEGTIVYAGNEPNVITKLSEDNGKMTITDTAWNDTTHVYGFTSSAEKFKDNLRKLPESGSENTGANYTAAIEGLRYLLKDETDSLITSRITNVSGNVSNNGRRNDAKKIVVMLSSTDPTYGYVKEDGEYDDTYITDRIKRIRPSRSSGVQFHTNFKAGYSYGNGQYFSRVGLNQARGILSTLDGYAAFYSVGIGNTENWKHLKELTQAHGYDQSSKWAKFGTKFIRAKSALAEGADSAVFNGQNPVDLSNSFSELERRIAPKVTDFTIKDTLSENVTLVKNIELKAEVYKMKDNGVEVEQGPLTKKQMEDLGLNGFNLTRPDSNLEEGGVIKLTTNPSDFSLPAGYEIRLTARIKPSAKAYEKLSKGQASANQGGDRTDLQDIYSKENIPLPSVFYNAAIYGTSAGKDGLFTNKGAEFTYNWNGEGRKKEYPNPIIKPTPREYLRINKFFIGFENEKLYDKSSATWTELGKKVLKDVYFDIYRTNSLSDKPEKLLTIQLGDEDWINGSFKEDRVYNKDGYEIRVNKVDEKESRTTIQITIHNMPMNTYYKIEERVEHSGALYLERDNDTFGYKFKEIHTDTTKAQDFNRITKGQSYEFRNEYIKEKTPKKKVIVKKEVLKFGAPLVVTDNRKFDFYLALKERNNDELTDARWESIFNELDGKLAYPISLTKIPNIFSKDKNPEPAEITVLHFRLAHGEQIEIPLEPGLQYNVIERQEKDFDTAIITLTKAGWNKAEVTRKPFEKNGLQYSCTGYLIEEWEETLFQNPKKLPIPTGIVREVTPYLFGIFGFIAMAGVYLTINKKRREA